jgi:tetratricopeptide (TPR) repeat protein
VARSKLETTGPGSIADTVAHLAIWARRAPRGFAHVEYHSEYARAEADRQLGEILLGEKIPHHHVELPVRVTPSEAGWYLLEELEKIKSGVVSITGFATAVVEEGRRDFLAILSVRREILNELGLRQIWWLTSDFREALMHIAPDLDSWFMVRLRIEEEFSPPGGDQRATEPPRPASAMYPIDEALRRAASLVERFQRAKAVQPPMLELAQLATWAADAIVEVGAPNLTRGLTDQLVNGLIEACRASLADCVPAARSLNSFARLLIAQGRVEEALPLIERARTLVEREESPDHPDVARDLHNLALLLLDANRLEQAEAVIRRAWAIAERVHGPWHPSVARCLTILAGVYRDTGRLGEAEACCRRALAIDEKNLGPDHPDVASDLNNLAVLLRATNRLAEAEPLYRRALAIDERCFGPDHPSVATDLNNLAVLLHSMNRLDEAEVLHRRALAIDEPMLDQDHPVVATDLVNLAFLLRGNGRLNEAEPLARRALAIDERIYGPDHPSVIRDRDLLASLLKAMNRPTEAEALLGQRGPRLASPTPGPAPLRPPEP